MELGTWCWPRVVLIEKRPLTECERSSINRAARSVGACESRQRPSAAFCRASSLGHRISGKSQGQSDFARVYTTKPLVRAPSGYATATLAPSKGRLMRCTVDGLTPNRSAMTRMPGRPGVARASRIRFSSAEAIGGRPRRFPTLGPSQARRGRVPGSWRARTRQPRPSSETSPCLPASWCRAPVGAGIDRS